MCVCACAVHESARDTAIESVAANPMQLLRRPLSDNNTHFALEMASAREDAARRAMLNALAMVRERQTELAERRRAVQWTVRSARDRESAERSRSNATRRDAPAQRQRARSARARTPSPERFLAGRFGSSEELRVTDPARRRMPITPETCAEHEWPPGMF